MSNVTFGGGMHAGMQAGMQGAGGVHGPGGRHGRHQDPVEVVATTLKLSAEDIRAQLRQGQSLDDVAQSQGVSHEELITAIKSGMPEGLKNSSRSDQVAERIATRKGPSGPPPPPPGGGDRDGDGDDGGPSTGVLGKAMTASQQQTLQSLSALLEMSSDDLTSQLRSGTSLADLVQSKGISSSSLASVLQNGLLVDTKA